MLKRLMTAGLITTIAVLPCASIAELAPERADVASTRSLDLRAPDIGKIFTLEQINAVLAQAIDPALEYIEVEALRLGDLPLEDNSATARESAARTLAWLVFGPVANPTPDATDPYRAPPALASYHHAAFDPP